MIKKEKVFELKIEEDDDISGIDSISLVDDPAIEVNWIAFNKHKEDFYIPDGEDEKYLELIMSKSEAEEDLLNDGWEIASMRILGEESFFGTEPNQPSAQDTEEYRVRYKYILNPNISQSAIINTTRQFCRTILNQNRVWRIEDMDAVFNEFGQPATMWRGGYNCRHRWAEIKYKRDSKIINKASVKTGVESESVPQQPTTYTDKTINNPSPSTIRNLGLAKEKFGYPLFEVKEEAEAYAMLLGCSGSHEHKYGDKVLYMPCEKHPEDMGYDVGGLPPYVDQVSGDTISKSLLGSLIICKDCGWEWEIVDGGEDPYICHKCGCDNSPNKDMFASYSDYPDAVKNNAKAVLKYVEENGWGSCGTEVGKIRANQLAKGEPISLDTIKRMYSYLSRHEVDLESSKGYGDGCGKLMYDSWGGRSAIAWAKSKINQAENMSKQYFQIDNEEKRIVLGPAMIPDLKIFRKDALGNPYYVFFSEETIKMIAEKYMKNQYTRNNDLMHDGKAVTDIYVVESWIKEDDNDKSVKYGYGDLPIGTWFISMKIPKTIKGDEVWQQVKEGKLNGFSVSGFFEEVKAFTKEEAFLYQVAEILKKA